MSLLAEKKKVIFYKLLLLTGLLSIFIAVLLSQLTVHFLNAISTIDTRFFLFVNGHHNEILDKVMYFSSDKFFWTPFYALLVYLLLKIFGREIWKVLIILFFLIFASDQIASNLIKNSVKRLRPSHEISLSPYIHLSKDGAGGLYGFVSSHASNASALMLFLSLIFKKVYNWIIYILSVWMFLVSYSRIYNGVHYPSDILVGLLIGFQVAVLFYMIFKLVFINYSTKPENI